MIRGLAPLFVGAVLVAGAGLPSLPGLAGDAKT